MDSLATFSYGILPMDTPALADQQNLTYNNAVRTGMIVLSSYQDRWPIRTDVELKKLIEYSVGTKRET